MHQSAVPDNCLEDLVRAFIWVIYRSLEFGLLNRIILEGN
jgi:hypothetical protein